MYANIKVYEYCGLSHNLSNHIFFNKEKGIILLASEEKLSEVEILGIGSVVNKVCNMFNGLSCDITISIAKYDIKNDILFIKSTSSYMLSEVLYTKKFIDIKDNLKDYELEFLNKYNDNIICIEYHNEKRKNTFINNILKPKKDEISIYNERNFDNFY